MVVSPSNLGTPADSSSPLASTKPLNFVWRPFVSVILSIVLFIFLLHLRRDVLLYSMHQFGSNLMTAQVVELQLFSVVWIFFLSLIVDFLGARRGILGFYLFSLAFAALVSIKPSIFSLQMALEFFAVAEILLVLVILKASAVYYKGFRFLVFLSVIYGFSVILLHFESPVFAPNLPLPHFHHSAWILTAFALLGSVLIYFVWPSYQNEIRQYDLERFREILKSITRLKAWAAMISLGTFLFFTVLFFKIAVLYYFPALLDIDDGYEEASFLFGFGSIVGFFIYSFIFKNTPYLGRVVGASLALAILCLLGIGFLSMSEELIWCLVALVGVFVGSGVLVFRLLLEATGVVGFATGCGISLLLAGAAYSIFGLTIFQSFHEVSSGVEKHHLYIHLWWSGIFLLVIPMFLMLLLPNIKLSAPLLKGTRAQVGSTLAQYWKGESSLSSAFWLLSVVGRWIVIFILFWAVFSFWFPSNLSHLIQDVSSGTDFSKLPIDWYRLASFGVVLSICGVIIGLFLVVSVWRCGRKALWLWRYLSRVITVLSLLRNILLFFGISTAIYLHFHPEIMAKYVGKFESSELSRSQGSQSSKSLLSS
jgi:hypothetical protein